MCLEYFLQNASKDAWVLYPEDFTLMCLGYIDQASGSIFNREHKIAFGYDCLEIDNTEGE